MKPEETIETPVSFNMIPYSGPWTQDEAAHLLRRTVFGATYQQIQDAVANGMNTTITNLLTIPTINPPVASSPDEATAAFGSTWVTSVYPADNNSAQLTENARVFSLAAWAMERLNTQTTTIAEKICLFWQNHFSAEPTFDARASYNYHNLIRTHALGNFKQLIKDMTIDPSMLFFLNGVSNQTFSPNENYARELLELYTIGKGPLVAPGDYTNYTEDDVAAGAKILTGWTVDGMRSTTIATPVAVFNPTFHNTTNKTLSAHFNDTVINSNGSSEYADYIDVIFQQDEVARFICRKFYRYFVNYDLTTDVENNVISAMAQTFIDNNYSILPVLQELFTSEHFYDISLRGTIIKSPTELIFSMYNPSEASPAYDLATNHEIYLNVYWLCGNLGQNYLTPPNVGGWPEYYQAPSFSKLWINSAYLKRRFDIGAWITLYGGIQVNNNNFKVDALTLVDGLSLPSDAPTVIDDLCVIFFPKDIGATLKYVLKVILTNNLPDFEWTVQYNDYIANPGNTTYSDPVKARVEAVLYRIFQMPEFQTI